MLSALSRVMSVRPFLCPVTIAAVAATVAVTGTAAVPAAGGERVSALSHGSALCARLLTAADAGEPDVIQAIADAYAELISGPAAALVSIDELRAMLGSGRFFELSEGTSVRDHVRDGLREIEGIARTAVRDQEGLAAEIRSRLAARVSELARADASRADARDKAAAEAYVTSTGAVFTRVRHAMLGLGWRDPSGMVWSKPVPGRFKNEGRVEKGLVVDSEATRACAELGGRLPTKEEFERLRSYFELGSDLKFTDSGCAEFYGIFPAMKNTWFWSASVYPHNSYYAYDFNGYSGYIYNGSRDSDYDAVLCVAGR